MMYKIPICRPSLPDINQYIKELKKIWKTKSLSNFSYYANKFETICKKYLKSNYNRILTSADIGLILSLSVLDLKSDDEVILSSFTFNSTANAVRWNHLKPVFADINKDSWCLDPQDVKRKITSKTKVILATHVFGNPCQINELRNICNKYKLTLIFDSAHAYGSLYHGKKIGTLGDIEVFSFSGTKIVTSAEGGLLTTNKKEIFDKITAARNYGFINNYNSVRNGVNGKISELNSLLGCLNLIKIEDEIITRQKVAKKYKDYLKNMGDISFQKIEKGNRSTYKDFGIITSFRDELYEYMERHGIQTKKYFRPIHLMDWYNNGIRLPITEDIARRCLCLPIYNEITEDEQLEVINIIKNFFINKRLNNTK
jgi:dTDP-4-amino-4,6-dideoxygalactose transaminase